MNRRLLLINWVRARHEGQLIKETIQPYFDHVLAVANIAEAAAALTYEIGLCHDLLEKTTITKPELQIALINFGYHDDEATHISNCVVELTRHFTKHTNPLPKKERKALEDGRLLTISADAQTVKYADLLYNADWMMQYDRHHAMAYIKRMTGLVGQMITGDATLQERVLLEFKKLLAELKNI